VILQTLYVFGVPGGVGATSEILGGQNRMRRSMTPTGTLRGTASGGVLCKICQFCVCVCFVCLGLGWVCGEDFCVFTQKWPICVRGVGSAPSPRPSGLCFEFRKLCECVLRKMCVSVSHVETRSMP